MEADRLENSLTRETNTKDNSSAETDKIVELTTIILIQVH